VVFCVGPCRPDFQLGGRYRGAPIVVSRCVATLSRVLRQSPACKNMNTEAEDIVGIRHQATTGEGIAN
jgi:hypothetical protein